MEGAMHSQETASYRPAMEAGAAFLRDLQISNGPRELLGRSFLQFDSLLARVGVRIEISTFEELLRVNQANRDSWLALNQTFNVSYNRLDPNYSACFIGRNASGEAVTAQALQIFDWSSTSLHEEAESLRLFYQHPDSHRLPNETCTVTAPNARKIRGRVLYGGAMWHRPDTRGLRLTSFLPLMFRAYAIARWDFDVNFVLMSSSNIARGLGNRTGHGTVECGIHCRNSTQGDVDFHLAWSTRAQVIDRISQMLAQAGDDAATAVARRAQE